MKTTVSATIVALIAVAGTGHCLEAPPTHTDVGGLTATGGRVIHVFADPNDMVIQLDQNGRCGSNYFHVQRTSTNFNEMTAVALTAFSTEKTMTMFVASCSSERNIVSHGYVSR